MFRHNLLIILRNIKRNKSSFLINLIGLSTGLACALLIFLWVTDELNFDRFHKMNSQLFQVVQQFENGGKIEVTPGPLAETLAEEMSEVEYATPVYDPWVMGRPTLSFKNNNTKANYLYAGKDFFNVFSFDLVEGNADQVLAEKNAIVISEELAMKLFNTTENIIGKSIEFKNSFFHDLYTVSGILEQVPRNSSLQFDFILSYADINEKIPSFSDWGNNNPYTYLVLRAGTDVEQFNRQITGVIERKSGDPSRSLSLRPFADKYLYGGYENGEQAGGRIEYVKLFSIIAIFIVIIACINFMNLSTAKASRRFKEIGIKKAVGANRKNLVLQYLGESVLMALLSLTIAMLFVGLLLSQFNEITGKQLTLSMNVNLMISALGIALLAGLVAGSYPALYLSGFNPVSVLKGSFKSSGAELWTRKGLVVFQFAVSSILIVSVLVIYQQIQFIQTKNLGFDKDNIIYFDKEGQAVDNLNAFLAEVKNIPGVVNASSTAIPIIGNQGGTEGISWEGKSPNDIIYFNIQFTNYDFIDMHNIEMKEGRAFSRDFGTDDSKIIFNEAAIKMMNLNEPIGQVVNMWGQERQIIGVTNDFHFESFHETVKPMAFILAPQYQNLKIMVKIKTGTEKATIERLEKFYQQYNPGYVLEYKFLDEDYQAQYVAEKRVAMLSRYFAGLAILISCLGLFGLAAFTAEQRTKEIGVRKVLGSSVTRIVFLISSDFTIIILVSMLISLPVSYFITKHWLDSFVYRIDLKIWYFVVAALVTLFVSWVTVGMQAIKAATANPVESLRYE